MAEKQVLAAAKAMAPELFSDDPHEAHRASSPLLVDVAQAKVLEAARLALSAALAQAEQPVAVKPLEWVDLQGCQNGTTKRFMTVEAKTPFTRLIVEGSSMGEWFWSENMRFPHTGPFDDEETAKAAAQADYERRILSALAHPPAKREAGETVVPQSQTHVDGERKFCDFPECGCSSGAAERCSHPPVSNARGSAEAVGDPYAWLFHDPPPAPSQHVTVKQLRWKGPDSSGEYHSLDGLWGYVIRARNGNGYWLSEVGEYRMTVDAAKAAAQADYERRVLAALDPSPAPREDVSDTPSAALEASHE